MKDKYPIGLTLISVFAIFAGIGEIIVGLTGNYLGILSKSISPSVSTTVIGSFYSLGGIAFLTRKKWGAALGVGFIAAEVLGRVYLIVIGIAPSHGIDALKILIGALIAIAVIVYIILRWEYFR